MYIATFVNICLIMTYTLYYNIIVNIDQDQMNCDL